ncbi:hypothetical protein [Lysinibacillus sphaericus]|uniref:hypothetical protein n=2 Tax=Bacillaceae TaxID=186817 RepID=UPI0018CFB0D1|nr:hypothetical protein [Lysinibacillus sphaericus]
MMKEESKMINEYKVDWCPLCDQGWVIIVKDIQTSSLYLCCKECESEWKSPYEITQEQCLPFNTYAKYDFPTEDEVISYGWAEFIKT